uniref:Uncharacterized protein n=1 Tax=Bombus-associated virus Pic2 TaxID=2511062 RepID=A0A411D3D3_9VIRU|nr:hypothetical protein [Bombus-associated virus Pic2]
MNRFPHPSTFGLEPGGSEYSEAISGQQGVDASTSTLTDADLIQQGRNMWQWSTGRSSADVSTQTQRTNNTNGTMAYLLGEFNKINIPMSPYERYMSNTSPMSRIRTPNMGQAISSGLNAAENEHMYGRVSDFQGHQNDLDRSQAQAMQRSSFDQQTAMQQAEFGQQSSMQRSQQDFDRAMAAQNYGYQSQMQQAGFANQQSMQSNEFGQQRQMQANSQQFQQQMAGVNYGYSSALQHQSILGNLANTVTGGVFGALTEGVHELGEYANQKSSQNFQEKMNPILFGQQQQLQSAQITGNLENTGIQTLGNVAISALSNAASLWMNHTNNEFQQAQQARNFNNMIYASGQGSQALKIAE